MSSSSPPIPAAAWRDPLCVIALGFGVGALPKAPGTWGTLMALPFYLLLTRLPVPEYLALTIALFAFGIWICGKAGRILGVHDHGAIIHNEPLCCRYTRRGADLLNHFHWRSGCK